VDEIRISERIDKEVRLLMEANSKEPYNHEEYKFHQDAIESLLNEFAREYITYGMPDYFAYSGNEEHIGWTLSAEDIAYQLRDMLISGDCYSFAEAIDFIVAPFERAIKFLRQI